MKTPASVLNFSPSFSAPAAACPRAAPPWRILALLAALVLLAHALALGAAPADFGPVPMPAPKTVPVMLTRSLSPPQPAPATPAPAVARPPAPAAPNPPPAKPLAGAQKTPAPAQEAPAAPASEVADDGPPQSSADQFSGLEQGADPEEAPAPSPQVPPKAPPASANANANANASAAATTPPAAPPGKPGQRPVGAIILPASAEMDYQVTGNIKGLTYHAKGELLWRRNASSYQTQMTVKALLFGSRGMSSQGQLGPEGLAPTRFEDQARSEVAAHFEPGKGQISFSANTPSVHWVKGAQDRASVLIQLGAMLAGNPAAFPAGSSISVYTVGPRDADTWTFRVEDGEILNLPFGQLATIKLSRQLRSEHDKKLEVWYAPALDYLPVRNKISEDNGDFVDQQLSALRRP